ncbi:hypothetical protein F2Q69_00007307 [Brassica cretica]|uniref:Uncharacterized protein n=1 Tax=Brassica cretica TaxID=69181 RepID=A0A8S9PH25_BRACR|nr:hypothetical protein F2Q69_00007307 [Brassica cretica]
MSVFGFFTTQVKSGMIQVKSGIILIKSGMIHVKCGMIQVKSGMILIKSGMIQVKSLSAVSSCLSRWLGRTCTGSVRSVFRTWTWSKLHSGCKWVEAVHGSIILGGTARKANLG